MAAFCIGVVLVTIFFGISFTCLALNFVTNKDYGPGAVEASSPALGFLAGMCGGFQVALLGTLGFVYGLGLIFELAPDSPLIGVGVTCSLVGGFLTPLVALFIPRT